jgi:hypothetical protein
MTRRYYVDPEINQPTKGHPLFIGGSPGYEEVTAGKPFAGKGGRVIFGGHDQYTGEYMQGSIVNAGLMRQDCNITYRVPKQAWNGDFYRHSWDDIKDGQVQLERLIGQLEPSFIVACGPEAAYDLVPQWPTLTDRRPGEYSGGRSIKSAKESMDRRGFMWLPADGAAYPTMPILDPWTAYYSPMPHRVLVDIDMQRMGSYLRGDFPRQHFPTFTRITNESHMDVVWDSELVAYDIEITWGGEKFLCIALYTYEGHAFLAYDDGLGAVREWLVSDRPKLAHNGQFDRYFLDAKMGIPVGGRHEDTIVGHWACYPEMAGKADTGGVAGTKKGSGNQMTRKGLNFLASFHLNYPWWKTYTSSPDLMGRLCVNDVVATMDCYKIVNAEVDDMGVRWQYEQQLAKIPALIAVQKRGMLVDEEMRAERVATLHGRQTKLYEESAEAALSYLKEHHITHDDKGKELWWYHAGQCQCCNGAALCKQCNEVKDFKKSTLIGWGMRQGMDRDSLKKLKVAEIKEMLQPCTTCDGTGKVDKWDFNPMSSTQLPALLWSYLGVPKSLISGKPDASEETIKKVLSWAKS